MSNKADCEQFIRSKLHPILLPFVKQAIIDYPPDPYEHFLNYLTNLPSFKLSLSEEEELKTLKNLLKNGENKESDSENSSDDEESDIIEDLPLPSANKIKPRSSVSAEAFGSWNRKSAFIARTIPKTAEQESKLQQRLEKSFMFSALEEKEKQIVVHSMEERKFESGQWVIRQGNDGNELFVVESGSLECSKVFNQGENPRILKVYGPGEAFGELSLLYNTPRAASIQALTDSVCWVLDRGCFNHIVKDSAMKKREKYEEILNKVEILKSVDAYERSQIADALKTVSFGPGDFVIQQGDWGELFYMIESGQAIALKSFNGQPPVKVKEYSQGDYFGELSLLEAQPRAASIQATTVLNCLTLDRKGFKRMLGPLTEILKRQAKNYN